jgi:hypothetical protein
MEEISIFNYRNDIESKLINSFNKGLISLDTFEKAKRDLSKLKQEIITDVNGHVKKVWVLKEEYHPLDLKHKRNDIVETKDGKKHTVIGYKGSSNGKGEGNLYALQDEKGNIHDKFEHNIKSSQESANKESANKESANKEIVEKEEESKVEQNNDAFSPENIIALKKLGVIINDDGEGELLKEKYKNLDFVKIFKEMDNITNELKDYNFTYKKEIKISKKEIKFSYFDTKKIDPRYVPNFKVVREFMLDSRDKDKKIVKNDYLFLTDKLQGKGYGKKISQIFFKQFEKADVDVIKIFASSTVGGYTWARAGFRISKKEITAYIKNWRTMTDEKNKHLFQNSKRKAEYVDSIEKMVNDFYDKKENEKKPFPMNLIATMGQNNEIGKIMLLQTNWNGVLNLKDKQEKEHYYNYINNQK